VRVIIYSISYLRATHARRYWRLDQRLDSQESSQGRGIPRIPSQTLHYNPSRQRGFLFRVEGDPRLESGEVNSSSYYNFKRGGESPKVPLLSISLSHSTLGYHRVTPPPWLLMVGTIKRTRWLWFRQIDQICRRLLCVSRLICPSNFGAFREQLHIKYVI
jgi:hypothetical protein